MKKTLWASYDTAKGADSSDSLLSASVSAADVSNTASVAHNVSHPHSTSMFTTTTTASAVSQAWPIDRVGGGLPTGTTGLPVSHLQGMPGSHMPMPMSNNPLLLNNAMPARNIIISAPRGRPAHAQASQPRATSHPRAYHPRKSDGAMASPPADGRVRGAAGSTGLGHSTSNVAAAVGQRTLGRPPGPQRKHTAFLPVTVISAIGGSSARDSELDESGRPVKLHKRKPYGSSSVTNSDEPYAVDTDNSLGDEQQLKKKSTVRVPLPGEGEGVEGWRKQSVLRSCMASSGRYRSSKGLSLDEAVRILKVAGVSNGLEALSTDEEVRNKRYDIIIFDSGSYGVLIHIESN